MTNSFARASFQAPAATGDSKGTDATTFKPVQNAPEVQSGERLLVEAYAAIWIILFVLILFGWRRQRRIDARITDLEAALVKARAAEPAKKAEVS
jgi:CcmD family protein